MHRDDLHLPPLAVPAPSRIPADDTATPTHILAKHRAADDYCLHCLGMALVVSAVPSLPVVLIVR